MSFYPQWECAAFPISDHPAEKKGDRLRVFFTEVQVVVAVSDCLQLNTDSENGCACQHLRDCAEVGQLA